MNLMRPVVFLITGLFPFLPGCSTEMAYNTLQRTAEQACYHEPSSEQDRCLERIYKADYKTYRNERP